MSASRPASSASQVPTDEFVTDHDVVGRSVVDDPLVALVHLVVIVAFGTMPIWLGFLADALHRWLP